jgi:hypothetical protein
MNKLIYKLLSVLKEHVNQNNKDIQLNQEEIEKLLSDASLPHLKSDLDNKYSYNRQLLNENSDFVKMQLELTEFFEKYRHLFPEDSSDARMNEPEQNERQKIFSQTVSGKLKFDSSHPHYNNSRFIEELFKYYEMNENYEMCEQLLKLRKI